MIGHTDRSKPEHTVLLVDDEAPILNMLTPAFESMGFRVFTARDGKGGLEEFRARRHAISIIVTDIKMEGMSGIEMAASMLELNPKLPVLFISGYSGAAFGMDSFGLISRYRLIEKPFSPIRLVEAAEQLLARNEIHIPARLPRSLLVPFALQDPEAGPRLPMEPRSPAWTAQ